MVGASLHTYIISESKPPVAVDGNLIFFFFGCEFQAFGGRTVVLALTHQLWIEKRRRGCIQNTATEEAREEHFVKLPSPPSPSFFFSDRLPPSLPTSRNRPIYLTNRYCFAAERYGHLQSLSRFLFFFLLLRRRFALAFSAFFFFFPFLL